LKSKFLYTILFCIPIVLFGQDTLSGIYPSLKISAGLHVIKDVVTVKGQLTVEQGAKIELLDPGVIVCEGGIDINGINQNIEFFGKAQYEGLGLVIKNIDSSRVNIVNASFKYLQMPIFFDFGWKRTKINISNNNFIENVGRVSIIQVLNPPFSFAVDQGSIEFNLENNLFSNNNAPVYFEDFKSDIINLRIINNTFAGNKVFGYKNYNISTNILYGRSDKNYTKYSTLVELNSFVFNYLIDNNADTVTHASNFGIYGTEKTFKISSNYLGSTLKSEIAKTIYDQSLNYNAPQLIVEPFLIAPAATSPSHVYNLQTIDNKTISDSLLITEPLKGLILLSNNELDLSKLKLGFSYFVGDSTLQKIDTTLSFTNQPNGKSNNLTITKFINTNKRAGYYSLTGMIDNSGRVVPDVNVGYNAWLNEFRKRKALSEILAINAINTKRLEDSVKMTSLPVDSIKNTFQKIEAPVKSRIELGLLTGGAIFTGTISSPGLFNNQMNIALGVTAKYTLFSNLSAGLTISSFKLSNSDRTSNNNEQLARGMSFSSSVLSISPSINYDFVDNRLYTKARKIRPSVGLGLDINSFAPTSVYNGVEYKLQPLGTGGQFSDSTKKPYSLLALGYFLNVQVKYQINRFNSVGIHFSFHKSMSDYLDDVGPDEYPNASKILASGVSDPAAALYFSNPTARSINGLYRNSPNNAKDSYIIFGIFYARKLFK
jgi:hypothetical protein